MLDKPKGRNMSVQSAVQSLADAFADAEEKAAHIRKKFRQARKDFEEIRDNGAVGGLMSGSMACEMDALATQFEADLWSMHSRYTQVARELGIDLPQRDGGR